MSDLCELLTSLQEKNRRLEEERDNALKMADGAICTAQTLKDMMNEAVEERDAAKSALRTSEAMSVGDAEDNVVWRREKNELIKILRERLDEADAERSARLDDNRRLIEEKEEIVSATRATTACLRAQIVKLKEERVVLEEKATSDYCRELRKNYSKVCASAVKVEEERDEARTQVGNLQDANMRRVRDLRELRRQNALLYEERDAAVGAIHACDAQIAKLKEQNKVLLERQSPSLAHAEAQILSLRDARDDLSNQLDDTRRELRQAVKERNDSIRFEQLTLAAREEARKERNEAIEERDLYRDTCDVQDATIVKLQKQVKESIADATRRKRCKPELDEYDEIADLKAVNRLLYEERDEARAFSEKAAKELRERIEESMRDRRRITSLNAETAQWCRDYAELAGSK